MKKIGMCIQFEGVDNYGTVLQAMANVRTIENLGHEPRLIRYKKKYNFTFVISQIPRFFDITHWKIVARRRKRKKNLKNNEVFRSYKNAVKNAFAEYRKIYFSSDKIDTFFGYDELKEESKRYDAVQVGSDQLWLPTGLKSGFYNLNFAAKGVKRISYSTSFGVSAIPNSQRKATREYLTKIDSVSVREASGQQIIKELTGRDAFLACDPVMLLKKEEWEAFANSIPLDVSIPDDYLLCYFLGDSVESRNAARSIANARGLKIVSLSYVEDYCPSDDGFGDIVPKGMRPEQFVGLIKNANCVMTDSFHGTAFSIIFEKQFLTTYRFKNSSKLSKNSRIDNILAKFHINDRLFIGGNATEQMQNVIDYSIVSEERERWRKESLDFLINALEG